ncbi:MAG: hypothetical protein Q7S29_03605 [Candidatus Peribacter sp.]|nr:hypothetical protein [Candidatus Peribacter sp.]
MVTAVPDAEMEHLSRYEEACAADAAEDTVCGRTLTGREAVNQAITQMMTPIHRLSTDMSIEPRVTEQLKGEARALRQKGEKTEEQNDLFVLAGEMHRLGQRAADLLTV